MPADMQLKIVAALLRRGRGLDLLSQALTLAALVLGLLFNGQLILCLLLAAVVLLGGWQLYWALRVGLDAELFEYMAGQAGRLAERTEAMDQALVALGFQPAEGAGRSWPERQRGALRLLRYQAVLVGVQLLLLVAGMLLFTWLG